MKCPVCKKKLNLEGNHKYVKLEIKYDNVLDVRKYIGAKRLMHGKCAKTYRAAEKIMISAGVIKTKIPFLKLDRDKAQNIRFLDPNGKLVGNNATFTIWDDVESHSHIETRPINAGGRW